MQNIGIPFSMERMGINWSMNSVACPSILKNGKYSIEFFQSKPFCYSHLDMQSGSRVNTRQRLTSPALFGPVCRSYLAVSDDIIRFKMRQWPWSTDCVKMTEPFKMSRQKNTKEGDCCHVCRRPRGIPEVSGQYSQTNESGFFWSRDPTCLARENMGEGDKFIATNKLSFPP